MRARALICSLPILAFAVYAAAGVTGALRRPVRATGVIRAVHSVTILVPFIEGQGGSLFLATLVENGVTVATGDSLATFDRSAQLKALREAQTKLDDLTTLDRRKKGRAPQ